jgi:hypothetical protein
MLPLTSTTSWPCSYSTFSGRKYYLLYISSTFSRRLKMFSGISKSHVFKKTLRLCWSQSHVLFCTELMWESKCGTEMLLVPGAKFSRPLVLYMPWKDPTVSCHKGRSRDSIVSWRNKERVNGANCFASAIFGRRGSLGFRVLFRGSRTHVRKPRTHELWQLRPQNMQAFKKLLCLQPGSRLTHSACCIWIKEWINYRPWGSQGWLIGLHHVPI